METGTRPQGSEAPGRGLSLAVPSFMIRFYTASSHSSAQTPKQRGPGRRKQMFP